MVMWIKALSRHYARPLAVGIPVGEITWRHTSALTWQWSDAVEEKLEYTSEEIAQYIASLQTSEHLKDVKVLERSQWIDVQWTRKADDEVKTRRMWKEA